MKCKEYGFKLLACKVLCFLSKRNTPRIAGCFFYLESPFNTLGMVVPMRAVFAPTLDVGANRTGK